MAIYCITYDLNKKDKNYDGLEAAIKKLGSWQHPQKSMWFVETSNTNAAGIFDTLAHQIDENDYLYVERANIDYKGRMPQSFWDWYNARSV